MAVRVPFSYRVRGADFFSGWVHDLLGREKKGKKRELVDLGRRLFPPLRRPLQGGKKREKEGAERSRINAWIHEAVGVGGEKKGGREELSHSGAPSGNGNLGKKGGKGRASNRSARIRGGGKKKEGARKSVVPTTCKGGEREK